MAESNPWRWPALQGARAPFPEKLEYQRGVFGKVHGARSDFRWIARSAGFQRGDELDRKLCLGQQDQPRNLSFWRYLPGTDGKACYFAGFAYPSRAQDATGRSGFLEMQIADTSDLKLPAALAALLLLPVVRQWNDHIWWDRRDEQNWLQRKSVLSIGGEDCVSTLADELETTIDQGLANLKALETENPGKLERFYASLLAGDKPAILYAASPLEPEALAVLLLPLQHLRTDRLSAAGWIPSSRYSLEDLGKCWDIVVLPGKRDSPRLSEKIGEKLMAAKNVVRALLENRPEDLTAHDDLGDLIISGVGFETTMTNPKGLDQAIPQAEPVVVDRYPSSREPCIVKSSSAEPDKPVDDSLSTQSKRVAEPNRKSDWYFHPKAAFRLTEPKDDTKLSRLLYDFARLVRRRTIKSGELKNALPEGLNSQYKPDSPNAQRLASQIDEWIKIIQTPPENVNKDQWECKLAQLRVLAWMLAPSARSDPSDPQEKSIEERFANVFAR